VRVVVDTNIAFSAIITPTGTISDIFSGSCSNNSRITKASFEDYYNITRLTTDSLTIRSGFTECHYVRPNTKSELCRKYSKNKGPLTNFDALWNTFNENYTYFNIREIDWNQSREKYRSKLEQQTTDLEFYKVPSEMVAEQKECHSSIPAPETLKDETDQSDYDIRKLRGSVITMIDENYVDDLKTYNKGIVNWGTIINTIGCIQVNAFQCLSNYSIDQLFPYDEFWKAYRKKAAESDDYFKDNLDGKKGLTSRIFQGLRNTRSCVRFNGGGYDSAGLVVLDYFTAKKTVAFSEKARSGDGFTKPQMVYVEPSGQTYPWTAILTSFQTASAGETFLLASQSLRKIKAIGSNTHGIFSDVLYKRLPNFWRYRLSPVSYKSANGVNYERYGIPPNINLDYEKDPEEFFENLLLDLKNGKRAIKKAINLNAEMNAP